MGYLARFKKILTKDNDLNQVQKNVEQAINPIINSPIVDGVLIKDACLDPTTVTLVQHKLGRKPLGWIVVRKPADARIWDVQNSNQNPTTTLALVASHAITVDLWIF